MDELDVEGGVWFKRGCSIIWDPRCLTRLVKDNSEITPISAAMRFAKTDTWPDELPAHNCRQQHKSADNVTFAEKISR